MSSGTFGYPLCFSAMLAAIGLFVSSQETVPVTSAGERAAYQEIVNLYNEYPAGTRAKCERFMALYPHSKGAEAIAIILGESLVKSGNWKEVGVYYRGLEARFPKSENLDRYVFFQGLAFFHEANLKQAILQFERVLKNFPNSLLVEDASYYLAMSNFLSNDYRGTIIASAEYLKKYPEGRFAGDMQYRLAFIAFIDKDVDQSDKIIHDLSTFIAAHPDDPANGSMLCLLGDTYKKKKAASDAEAKANDDKAIESYTKAVWTESPDDVIQYALESSINMLRARKDWGAIAELRTEFLKRRPHGQIAMDWMGEGQRNEASDILATALKPHIADPAKEQAEDLIDLLVQTLFPRKKFSQINPDELDKQLVETFNKIIAGQENATTTARVYYARGRLARLAKRKELAYLYLKGIATLNSKDPSPLSPVLLANSGDILLELGDIDGAERMFKRLTDHFPESKLVDAGPVGLGDVALARKKPEEALGVFEQALKKPGNMSFKEATLGKLEALVALGKFDEASQLALQIVGDKMFRGETASKCYLLLGQAYRGQAAEAAGADATKLLKKALGVYQRVYVAYQAFPDLCAEGYWQASEVAKELGEEELRQEILQDLLEHPKLKNNQRRKQAEMEK